MVKKCRLSARLAEERERLGKTQKEMAAIGDVGDRSYWHYEKGERSPDAECLLNLAAGGVDVFYVLTGNRTAAVVSDIEARLISAFRASPEAVQDAIMAALQAGAASAPATPIAAPVEQLTTGKGFTPEERKVLKEKAGIQPHPQPGKHRRSSKG